MSSVANSEYYKLLMKNQDERRDATVCTLEELERVISEHTLKNTVYRHTHTHTHTNTHKHTLKGRVSFSGERLFNTLFVKLSEYLIMVQVRQFSVYTEKRLKTALAL